MRLEQRLTPQLIQSMEILQLPLLALEARVRDELQSNPLLEEDAPALPEAPHDAFNETSQTAAKTEAEGFERLDRMAREYDFDPGDRAYGRVQRNTGERDAKMDAMANSAARGPSLQEHLEEQWALMDLAPEVKQAGLIVIDWMDHDGYLRTGAEHEAPGSNGEPVGDALALIVRRTMDNLQQLDDEIAHSVNPPIDAGVLEESIARVQTLEPRGVGARDLAECLLIQLDALSEETELVELLVEDHLEDVARNRFPAIVKETGRDIEEIKQALAVITRLHHHPGLLMSGTEVPRITPDILVDYADDGDGYTVRLTRGSSPRLRISSQYRSLLEARAADSEARNFIRKNLEAAKTLIDAIHFRRERLLELARIVVYRQREFFERGPKGLSVLRMRDIAEELGCDPSTISRTVDQKYIQSPRGIHPMRMFFTGGTETSDGTAISWNAVKQQVKEIIDQEDKSAPLSDDSIARQLSAQGHVKISRRTVAKYRAQLVIPAARERKQF